MKACIFDLDGTLTDTLPTIAHYVNLALAEAGLPQIEETERFCDFVGNGAAVLIERTLTYLGRYQGHDGLFDRVFSTYTKAYDEAPLYLTHTYEGMPELIDALRARGIRCAVLTNKPEFAGKEVVRHFYGDVFDTVSGDRDGVALKPAPDGLLSILDKLALQKEDALMIGDTGVDIATGVNAGVKTVGVLWGFRKEAELVAAGATYIVGHPSEILGLFD